MLSLFRYCLNTPLGENVKTDKINKGCPKVVYGKTICAYLVELPMHDIDVILCMDWIDSCHSCMDFRSTDIRLCFPNEEELVWEGYNSSIPNSLTSNLKANKMMSKGLLCHLMIMTFLPWTQYM